MFKITFDEGFKMKKLSAVLASIMIISSVAQGGIFYFQDDVMSHRFWVNTDSTKYVFGQQLLLPAVITSIHGDVITTDAMVIYDTRSGNMNFIHFGNYCILALNFGDNLNSHVMIANTGPNIQNVDCQYDWIYRIYNPTMSVGQKVLQSASEQDILREASVEPVPGTTT